MHPDFWLVLLRLARVPVVVLIGSWPLASFLISVSRLPWHVRLTLVGSHFIVSALVIHALEELPESWRRSVTVRLVQAFALCGGAAVIDRFLNLSGLDRPPPADLSDLVSTMGIAGLWSGVPLAISVFVLQRRELERRQVEKLSGAGPPGRNVALKRISLDYARCWMALIPTLGLSLNMGPGFATGFALMVWPLTLALTQARVLTLLSILEARVIAAHDRGD